MGPTKLPVLMYHDLGLSVPGGAPGLTVAPEEFERQVTWLAAHGYKGISPRDWIEWRDKGKSLPEKPVLITFDDGYASVATHGLPVLERQGFSATVFVVTHRFGSSNTWDQALGYPAMPLMSADEISHWAARGFEFGCHTRTHANLASLSEAAIEDEVEGSRDDLAAIINRRPTTFAYPWGSFNKAAHQCVRNAFDLAFSTRRGLNFRGTDLHLMRRCAVRTNRSMLDFAIRVLFGSNPAGRCDEVLTSLARRVFRTSKATSVSHEVQSGQGCSSSSAP
jgi:peptidoglycan/xylan/chitin deacetylase (PgdA/CDA1 family)